MVYVPSPLSVTLSAPAAYSLSTPLKLALTAYPSESVLTERVIVSPFSTIGGAAMEERITGGVLSSSTLASVFVASFPARSMAVTGIVSVPSASVFRSLTVYSTV